MWETGRHESERKKRWYRWIYRPKTAKTAKVGEGRLKDKGIHHQAALIIILIVMTIVNWNITYTEVLRMKSFRLPAVSCLMWPPPTCPLLYFFNFFACLLSHGKVNPWASISRNNLSNIKSFNMPNDNGASVTRAKLFYCSRSVISLSWVMTPSWLYDPHPLPPAVDLWPCPIIWPAVSGSHYAVYWAPHLWGP